jgi:hypothetical protein
MASITLGTLRDYWKGVYDAVATFGSAITAKGLVMGGSDGTNARAVKTDATGKLQVDIATALPAGTNVIGAFNLNQGIPLWGITQDSAADTTQTLSKDAVVDQRHHITAFEVVISGGDAGADISVILKDGTTAIWKTLIGSGATRGERVGMVLSQPLQCGVGNAASLEVGAGGADVITSASMAGYTA